MGSDPTSGLLTAEQVGELLSVPPSWVLAQARVDKIPHIRLGRYVRFDPVSIQQWMRSQERSTSHDG